MKSKKWAKISAFVGVLGGIFLTVSPLILFIVRNEQLAKIISILVICT